jgi:hypothetical protein
MYHQRIEDGESIDVVLRDMGITTICCRLHFITYAKTLTETMAIMSSHEPVTFAGGPLKIFKDNKNNRMVSSG